MDREILKRLGMTHNEIEIYLSLLSSKEQSVNEISSKTGLHRRVVYDAVERLTEKGFVSYLIKGKKIYQPLPPERLFDYLNEIKDEVNSIIPELKTLYLHEKEEMNVEVIKGKQVLRRILMDIFNTIKEQGGDLLIMGVEEEKFTEFDEIAILQHITRFRKNNFKEKLLSKIGEKIFYEGGQSEYRFIPEHMFNPNPTHVYGDKIAMVIWGNPTYGIIITNKQVADANRKFFNALWDIAKEG